MRSLQIAFLIYIRHTNKWQHKILVNLKKHIWVRAGRENQRQPILLCNERRINRILPGKSIYTESERARA